MISVFFTGDFHLVILPEKYFKKSQGAISLFEKKQHFQDVTHNCKGLFINMTNLFIMHHYEQ